MLLLNNHIDCRSRRPPTPDEVLFGTTLSLYSLPKLQRNRICTYRSNKYNLCQNVFIRFQLSATSCWLTYVPFKTNPEEREPGSIDQKICPPVQRNRVEPDLGQAALATVPLDAIACTKGKFMCQSRPAAVKHRPKDDSTNGWTDANCIWMGCVLYRSQ